MSTAQLQKERAVLSALREQGFVPRRGLIRSSAVTDYRTCPFQFLLKHRWGLQPTRGQDAAALRMGSYTHWCFEAQLLGLDGEDKTKFVQNQLVAEIEKKAIAPSTQSVDEMTEELNTARTWQEVAWSVAPIDLERYHVLFTEKIIHGAMPGFTSDFRGKFDGLLLDTHKNELWILDWKTTSYVPWLYIQTAPLQLQPEIYRMLLDVGLQRNVFHDLGIPRTATIAGVMHYVIQKPTIRISKKTAKKDGDKAAILEYRNRCEEWYRGIGEFAHLSEERADNQKPINMSYLRYYSETTPRRVINRLSEFDKACGALPVPRMFPMNETCLLPKYAKTNADLSPYHPFYMLASAKEMMKWPRIARQHDFKIEWREDTETTPDYTL